MRNVIIAAILIIVVSITGYVYWYYYSPYSMGRREGVLQKFSRKGNVFKTHEGEMIQLGFGQRTGGALNAQYFYFSVTDLAVADSLERCMGQSVVLHYIQYRRPLPWRGDNHKNDNNLRAQYVVDQILEVKDVDLNY